MHHGVDHACNGIREPAKRKVPAQHCFGNKNRPEAMVKHWHDVMQRHVGDLLRTLRIPQVPQQQRVGNSNDRDVHCDRGLDRRTCEEASSRRRWSHERKAKAEGNQEVGQDGKKLK